MKTGEISHEVTKAYALGRRHVVIGADLAKHTDFTVLLAMDAVTGQCLAMDRFNQLDWPIQKERILAFARLWRGRIYLDATGIGDPIYDDLLRVYPDIEPVKFTAPMKTALIQRLIVAIEQRQISWPAAWKVLTAELKRHEFVISSTGHISYNAPSGYNDDCVIALALANQGRWIAGNAGSMARLLGGGKRQGEWGKRRGERVVVG